MTFYDKAYKGLSKNRFRNKPDPDDFADGGRAGFMAGGMGRRAFLKMMAAGGAAAPAEDAEPAEEKTAFDVKLTSFDASSKINVIKEVRAITGLGLKEAKEFVEGAPKVIKEGLKKEECEEIQEKLKAVGGVVEIE